MAGLKIFLLGPPRVELNGAPIDIQRRKAMAMLSYLAVSGQPHSRDALATFFWPDLDQQRGRAYLRRDLAALNTSLPGHWLSADRDTVELNREAGPWLDIEQFQRLLAACREHGHAPEIVCAECIPLLTEALTLYTDDFLAGFTLRDSPEFDDWQFFQTESLRQELATALERLVRGLNAQGKAETAIPYIRRWVALDPLHEPAQRQLIQAYGQSGQPAAALRQYEEYVKLLEEELGLPPEEETTTLYEAIKAKRMLGPFIKAEEQRSKKAAERRMAEEQKRPAEPTEAPAGGLPPASATVPGLTGEELGSARDKRSSTIAAALAIPQRIRYCRTPDGVRLAYATAGQGPPLVKAANWLSHLEYDWFSPVWRDWLEGLTQHHTLVRYDERGCGLSDWDVADFSFEAWLSDLETVVEAAGLERFPLLGLSQGVAIAIAYAVRHPEKVSHLILYGGYARGRLKRDLTPQQLEETQTFIQLIKLGWGQENPAFRQVFTTLFIPEATLEQQRSFNELQRISTSPENAMRLVAGFDTVDVRHLAPQVTAPTLVLHAKEDARIPYAESQLIANLIPGARLVPLESRNHILLEHEPAWRHFLDEIHQFLGVEPGAPAHKSAGAAGSRTVAFPSITAAPSPHHLPPQSTPFIGRDRELADVRKLLAEPECRLLTLLGPGGIGKTRLALEATAAINNHFSHGIYFVPLAPLTSAEQLVTTIAESVNFHFHAGGEPKQQLLDFLRKKQLLLVLDNFEHLVVGAGLVVEILQTAPQVKMLVTSQERLNLSGETIYTLGGLQVPDRDTAEAAVEFDAVKLLLQQVRLVRPTFEPQTAELAAMIRICQLTQGMPLALMLAAGWLEALSLQEIMREMAHNLDFLETAWHDVPKRQRSVRAIFNYSWQRLSPEEQPVFMKLSVFRGGFTRPAAQTVTGADLPILRALVNKSFLSISRGNRYEIHELLRHYGAEQLAAAGEADQTREAHGHYYLNTLSQYQADLKGRRQAAALDEIEADFENIRLAWAWAIKNNRLALIEGSLESLYHFYTIRSHFQEGKVAFETAVRQLQAISPSLHPPPEKILGQLMARAGAFCYTLSLIKQATELLQQSLEIAQRLADQKEMAFSLNFLGELARIQGEYSAAVQFFQESLTYSRSGGDELSMARSLKGLGWAAGEEGGAYLEASQYYQEALTHYRALEHWAEIAFCLDKLGYSAWQLGNYAQAESLAQESLEISREIGDPLGIAKALGVLALVAMSLGGDRLPEAKSLAEASLATCQETGHQVETVNRLLILGLVLLQLGEISQGQHSFQDALQISRQISYGVGVTLAMNGLGEIALKEGDFQKSRNYLVEALKIARSNRRVQDIAEILTNFAGLLIQEARDRSAAPPGSGADLSPGQKQIRAVEILSLVLTYQGSWQTAKDKANHLLTQLESQLNAEVIAIARIRGKNSALESVIGELLESEWIAGPAIDTGPIAVKQRFSQQTLIARGGMGEVYQGWDTITGQPVAIKRLKPDLVAHHPEAIQRLIREGKILRQLNHPNIVKVLATLDSEGEPVIVMEYVPGGSLKELLDGQPQLPLERTLHIGLELADALARIHHLGILHRDFKPANILLAEDGTPRLTDFGVAFLAHKESKLTQEGAILGTTIYLSPEAWRGEPLDPRSDIWSFGAVLYEMLAGRPPFTAEQPVAIMTAVLNDPLPNLLQFRPDAPPALVELIKHMLVKERELRLDSMRQVAAGLEVIQRDLLG